MWQFCDNNVVNLHIYYLMLLCLGINLLHFEWDLVDSR
uniref:Uncharacterized protein n=1 Tax=Rhizophora mucronata TaxID=61149 RepID=A0A2P2NAV9_RHIMU